MDEQTTGLGQDIPAKISTSRILWFCALAVSVLLSILADFRGGYVGPDYNTHMARLDTWSSVFDFSTTSPPLYYVVARAVLLLVGRNNWFPFTLSILQVAINALALWYFFVFTERRFQSSLLKLGFVFFLTFLPVRIIHATVIGTDSATIPLFVLVLFLFDRFLLEETSTWKSAACLGAGLSLAVSTKYSFMALLPAIFVIFVWLWKKRAWSFKRFAAICALSLVLPSTLALYSFAATRHLSGYYTRMLWLPKGVEADMNFKDLLSVKKRDAELFQAPEYFKKQILDAHRHSYLGLSHLGIFTDTMNLFQDLTVPPWFSPNLLPDQKTRRPWKTPVMRASMALGTLWTVLALIGTPWILVRGLRNLWQDKIEREDISVLLGIAYFLLMFLPIPFVYNGDLFGYWTPRLILPCLLVFFWAAFLLLDRKVATKSQNIALVILVLVLVQAAIEIVMLA
jgi:4-amino-4-deoxy-L-arabinose transferase-like glycosyltransferase